MSECEIEKDGEYVGRYECATHGVWYCDSDTKPKESCPVGEAEEGLRREVERLTKMLEVCSVTHSHNVELKTEVERLKIETYCGDRGCGFRLDAPDATTQIGAHIGTCSKHPMRVVEAERDDLKREVAQLHAEIFGLKPYVYQAEELQAELRKIREAVAEGAPFLFLPE
jgi:hypothetical protein